MGNVEPKRILILGGGFAGLTVAMELEKKLGRNRAVEVTLVNRDNFFLFTPMLHSPDTDSAHAYNTCSPGRCSCLYNGCLGGCTPERNGCTDRRP